MNAVNGCENPGLPKKYTYIQYKQTTTMKMKPSEYLFVIIAFVVIIGMTACCAAKGVVPYSRDSIFTQQYAYEPYANMLETTRYSPEVISQAAPTQSSIVYKNVVGFNGVFPNPGAVEPVIDKFSELDGNQSCFNGSSGLSNSKGAICLSASAKQSLLTRGGNLTGSDSQIGSS